MLLRKCIVVCSIVFVSMIYNATAIENSKPLLLNKLISNVSALENTVKEKESEIKSLKENSDVITSRIEKLENQNSYNTFLANEGAVILLIGLFIEVFGALLLSAPVLAAKIDELSDFDIDPGLDMALHSPKKDSVLSFYAMVGNIFLFIGFIAQFAGTALVLSIDWRVQILIVSGGVVFALMIAYWLLGLDPTQSRAKKIAILSRNIWRILELKFSNFLLKGSGCEYCLKKVLKGESCIYWYDQGNFSKDHPFLNTPDDFFVGHKMCLEKKMEEEIESISHIESREKSKTNMHITTGQEFADIRYQKYKDWFIGHYDYWLKRNSSWRKPSFKEVRMDEAYNRIKKIES